MEAKDQLSRKTTAKEISTKTGTMIAMLIENKAVPVAEMVEMGKENLWFASSVKVKDIWLETALRKEERTNEGIVLQEKTMIVLQEKTMIVLQEKTMIALQEKTMIALQEKTMIALPEITIVLQGKTMIDLQGKTLIANQLKLRRLTNPLKTLTID